MDVKVNTAGDGFFAAFDGPARAIRCACAVSQGMCPLGILKSALASRWSAKSLDGRRSRYSRTHRGAGGAFGSAGVKHGQKDLVAGSDLNFRDRRAPQGRAG